MQMNNFNFLDDTLLIKEENDNKTAKKVRVSRRRKSKMSSLEARRAVEELMLVKQYQSYDKLYD